MSPSVYQAGSVGSVLLRSLLVVALWTGPVPWAHSHDLSLPGMAEHLAKYHQGQNSLCVGWHWHYSTSDGQNPASPDQNHPDHPPTSQETARPDVKIAEGISALQYLLAWAEVGADRVPLLDEIARDGRIECFDVVNSPGRSSMQLLCRMTC